MEQQHHANESERSEAATILPITDLSSSQQALPRQSRRNLWIDFPSEIRTNILNLSDPFTQFLNQHGRYRPSSLANLRDDKKQILVNDIWIGALEIEWEGDLATLPDSFVPSDHLEWIRYVKTKAMYLRIEPLNLWNKWRILNAIAMHHCWTELLPDPDEMVNEACFGGHLQYVLHLEHTGTHISDESWMNLALTIARQGHFDGIKYLWNTRPSCINKAAVDFAAASGNIELLHFLMEKVGTSYSEIDSASQEGHLHIVRSLHYDYDFVSRCSKAAMNGAAKNGHLDVVRFLHENRQEGCTTDAMDDAATNGHLAVVKFLHENRREGCTTKAMDWAAGNGHLDVVQFLHTHRHEGCTTAAIDNAAMRDHHEVLEFLQRSYPHLVD
ncbi:hypothetical protein HDV05_000186 [Chytridiales sp. JEL 0842]|nr:hypothetical protein HDV05_000186 [Chytridiales sp. JEL 0842]